MIKTDNVKQYLISQGESSFEKIWENVKDEIIPTITKEMPEHLIKADLYHSLLEDVEFVMTDVGIWALSKDFTFKELKGLKNGKGFNIPIPEDEDEELIDDSEDLEFDEDEDEDE